MIKKAVMKKQIADRKTKQLHSKLSDAINNDTVQLIQYRLIKKSLIVALQV